jgi:hypothetical protein
LALQPFSNGNATLAFVIPTRISCHAALDVFACAPFCKGKAHEVHQSHQVPQEIRGSVVEGSAVQRTHPGNVFDTALLCGLEVQRPDRRKKENTVIVTVTVSSDNRSAGSGGLLPAGKVSGAGRPESMQALANNFSGSWANAAIETNKRITTEEIEIDFTAPALLGFDRCPMVLF